MRIIAFYLPQFHEFPENNEWWGKGFTEWTNTRKAMPLFRGHYQPHIPYQNNYYDLSDTETMNKQIIDAKKYGVYGFCFYHYWFKNGKMLMEKPVEDFLANKNLDIKFCLSWANEPWTRAWDGENKQVLMPQDYGPEKEWIKHFDYILPFLKDKRYINIDDAPVFLIYRPESIPNLDQMLSCWKSKAKESGLKGITFIAQGSYFCVKNKNVKSHNIFNYLVMYEPGYTLQVCHNLSYLIKNILISPQLYLKVLQNAILKRLKSKTSYFNDMLIKFNYDVIYHNILSRHINNPNIIPGAFTGWDNTARRGVNARIVVGSTPEKFYKYMVRLIAKSRDEYKHDIIFIDAWNEWAEGAHLEPDEKYGYGYLEALKKALIDNNEFPIGG